MLVLEDERPLVEIIMTKLESNGIDVVTARTTEQAMQYLEDMGTIDAIWLDHYLFGKETGLDFVVKLKSEESKWKSIPVFIVSNTASSGNMQSYMQLGVNKYFVKAEHQLDWITKEIKDFLDSPHEE